MKQPWEWDEIDLLGLIVNRTQENIGLDYKRCDALMEGKKDVKVEVSKDVSAFANSAGGTIVYGMIENGHLPVALDSGYDPANPAREWLEQVINSNIQRKIDGVRIKSVELATHNPGKVAYVVYVPQSVRAPHQAADKKFYKRYNFESVPMEEYEVRDVMRRLEAPDLHVRFQYAPVPGTDLHSLQPLITNDSPAPAEFAIIHYLLDARLDFAFQSEVQKRATQEAVIHGDRQFMCNRFSANWSVSTRMPIFTGVLFQLPEVPFRFTIPTSGGEFLLVWNIRSPGMSEREGRCILFSDGKNAEMKEEGQSGWLIGPPTEPHQ